MKGTGKEEIEKIYQAYHNYYGYIPDWVKLMGERAPDALFHYFQLRVIGVDEGILPRKVKELILLGINLVRHYEIGTKIHIKGALDAGATEEEILETIVTAMVSGAASAIIDGPQFLMEELQKREE